MKRKKINNMKKTLIAMSAALSLAGCGNKQNAVVEESPASATKSVVIYYSQTHVTEQVAKLIAEATSADMDSIVAVEPYNGTFEETVARCKKEMESGAAPAVKPTNVDVAKYDTVYLGFPVWCGIAAQPVGSWMKNVDLSGKVVVPFCTFGSGGLETSVAELKKAAPNAKFMNGYGVRTIRIAKAADEVNEFLIRSGIKAGEVEAEVPFVEKRNLNDEEKGIYDAACGDYPYPLGTPILVSTRNVKNGTEYRYITESNDANGNPTQAEVFVLVSNEEGVGPEFTKVVR